MENSNIQVPDTTEIVARADDLIASVERAVIDSPESDNKGGDLLKMLKVILRRAEDDRKAITGLINASIKLINAKYKEITNPVDAAIKALNKKMIYYKQEQQRIAQENERIEREKREAEALEKAAQLESQGKDEAAEEVVNAAEVASETTQTEATKSTVRSDFGATTTMTDKWSAEVVNLRELCLAVSEGRAGVECILPNLPELNKLAKQAKEEKEANGVKFVNNPVLTSR